MLPDEPRTVKPRKPNRDPWLPLIVADRESQTIFCEMTGELYDWTGAPGLFQQHPASMVIAPGAAHLLAELDGHYRDNPRWQYRVSPVKRESFSNDPTRKRRRTVDTLVNYFGWRGATANGDRADRSRGKGNRRGHWHYPVDPTLFATAPVRDLLGGLELGDLLAWGKDLREWCHANGLHPSPTAGGLGGQLLRDARFYPHPRRKVPRATNSRARPTLPGNHYRLYHPEHSPVDATYIDMSSSHHHAALDVQAPCANHLYARGFFRDTDTTETPRSKSDLWAVNGTPRYNHAIRAFGLFRLQLNVPTLKPNQFPPPFMETPGRKLVYVYSNEIPTVLELGGDIEGIHSAWTGYELDTGLNRYAAWSLDEISTMTPQRKRWAKVALLATYGNLAAKQRAVEFGYRTATSGVSREYPAGPLLLPVQAYVAEVEQEIPTVNVIHRGMIEAQHRCTVLSMARHLTVTGQKVLSIYADAIILASDRALPLLPPPWRIDTHLTRLKFASPTGYTSAERTRLPGVPREAVERWRRISHFTTKT